MVNAIWVFLGGGLGSLVRFGIGKVTKNCVASGYPLGTLLANFFSCVLLIAFAWIIYQKTVDQQWLKPFLIIGFCGGLSTFSTFSLETVELLKTQQYTYAALNAVGSVLLCVFILMLFSKTLFPNMGQ